MESLEFSWLQGKKCIIRTDLKCRSPDKISLKMNSCRKQEISNQFVILGDLVFFFERLYLVILKLLPFSPVEQV